MFEDGNTAYLAFYLYLIMILAQWAVATLSKAGQPNAVPGKLNDDLSHESFVFRAHRTFQNTLENSPLFMGSALLAFIMNYQSSIFAISMWVYVIARLIHMALYYAIATEKNPSPRSYFFLIGVVANVVMLVMLGATIIA
jgi:uncharacterized MAPEG superfamily protein